jgi:hypothetical protein
MTTKKYELIKYKAFRKAYYQTFFGPYLPPQLKEPLKKEVMRKRREFRKVRKEILKSGGKEYSGLDEDIVEMIMLYK